MGQHEAAFHTNGFQQQQHSYLQQQQLQHSEHLVWVAPCVTQTEPYNTVTTVNGHGLISDDSSPNTCGLTCMEFEEMALLQDEADEQASVRTPVHMALQTVVEYDEGGEDSDIAVLPGCKSPGVDSTNGSPTSGSPRPTST